MEEGVILAYHVTAYLVFLFHFGNTEVDLKTLTWVVLTTKTMQLRPGTKLGFLALFNGGLEQAASRDNFTGSGISLLGKK